MTDKQKRDQSPAEVAAKNITGHVAIDNGWEPSIVTLINEALAEERKQFDAIQAENSKLRESLETIACNADGILTTDGELEFVKKIARSALKGT